LREHFSFEEIPPTQVVDKDAKPPTSSLALRLVPTDAELREHLESVLVLLNEERGLILRAVMTDADGDRTVLAFSDVNTNIDIKDDALQLNVPSDVKTIHPLEGFDPASAPRRRK
jgi:outer membrane lipoprotein-sorting protein